jgi:hypothetical protein
MKRLARWIHANAAALMMLAVSGVFWLTTMVGASYDPEAHTDSQRTDAALVQASRDVLQPGDIVVDSTRIAPMARILSELGVRVSTLNPNLAGTAQTAVTELLRRQCGPETDQADTATYWIWNEDAWTAADTLGPAARPLNFMFAFQAVLRYEGDAAFAIDKFLQLVPRERVILDYCEAMRLVPEGNVIVLVSPDEFAPWIGPVTTGSITWLASESHRTLREADLAAIDMPPLIGLDAYWVQVSYSPSWSFTRQERAAYAAIAQKARMQGYPVLLTHGAQLGATAASFFRECRPDETRLNSDRFRELCFR